MEYLIHLAVLGLLYALLAVSQVLMTGYLRLLTVVQAGFAGIGAYVAAILSLNYGFSFPITLLFGSLAAATISIFAYLLFSHLEDENQVLASLAFQVILIELMLNLENVTNGALGLSGISVAPFNQSLKPIIILFTLASSLLICATGIMLLGKSSYGLKLRLIGENRSLAESYGIDTKIYRLGAIAISAAIAGLAGGVFAHYFSYIDPTSFSIMESVLILAIVVIAGGRNLILIVITAIMLSLAPELFRNISSNSQYIANVRQILFGVCLVIAVFIHVYRSARFEHD